jgi:hypothetical protein
MKLSGSVPVLETAGFGVWRVEAAASDLAVLGKPCSRASGRSVIALHACEVSDRQESLIFQLSDVSLLNLGDADDCIAVLLEKSSTEELSHQNTASKIDVPQRFRSGDDAFIAACRSEGLPDSIVRLGQSFLGSIREFSEDKLQEGLHRKWVTYPKNFLAITIQNRNHQFCVHVKKSAMLSKVSDRLDVRDDRPGYVRFWLQDETQLSAAVRAAKGSFDL